MQAELALSQQLKRSFKIVAKNVSAWDQTVLQCRSCVDGICNLAEQLESCQKVKINATPLKKYGDLQERLVGKLITAMEDELAKLTKYQ